ncbi:hypothetical protein Hanom_Chr17g01570411 [Helianthus anomalus]
MPLSLFPLTRFDRSCSSSPCRLISPVSSLDESFSPVNSQLTPVSESIANK